MPSTEPDAVWTQSVRARLFATVFGLTLALGVGLTLLQPVIYRSSATVLMSPPSAIDAASEKSDLQSVAIQSRILLGQEVTQRLLSELDDSQLDTADLRQLLRVEPVPDTNLVEMIAQGAQANGLPALVNAWIDVYLSIRSDDIQRTQEHTLELVQDQLSGMAERLEAAREALATYRREHHITSVKQQQNEELARLEGLNSALNKAVANEVKTRSKLESLRAAIAAGKDVVPPDERKTVENMEKQLGALRARLAKIEKTYTANYIRNQPSIRDLPAQVAGLEAALDKERARGKNLALATAEQAHAAAQQSVADLQEKLHVQEQAAAGFTTIYAKHQALAEDLAELESVHRQAQSRLLQVEVNQVQKYPQVSVIDRPGAGSERIGPDYPMLLGASLAAALGMGVLSVWLYGFLAPRPANPAFVTLSGVHMYPQDMQQLAYTLPESARLGAARAQLPQGRDTAESRDEIEPGPDGKTPESSSPS